MSSGVREILAGARECARGRDRIAHFVGNICGKRMLPCGQEELESLSPCGNKCVICADRFIPRGGDYG